MHLDTLIPILAAVLTFVAVLLAGHGITTLFDTKNNTEKIRARVNGTASTRSTPMFKPLYDLIEKALEALQNMGGKVAPEDSGEQDKTRTALMQAGLRKPNSYATFQGVKAVLTIVPATLLLLGRFLFQADEIPLQNAMFGALFLAVVGCYLPEYWLKKRVASQQQALSDELPDALDLLVVCVEAGMGIDQAIFRVCQELRDSCPTISGELKILTLELRAGKVRNEALRSLATRTGLDDLNSLVTLLIQADIFGISVARTLRVYSDTMRTKRFQKAEEKAAKLPVLLLLPLITCILPALLIVIMGPAAITLGDVFSKVNN
ncbi:MAG: type II secretion system F family protein [Desulfovibrio sp.]